MILTTETVDLDTPTGKMRTHVFRPVAPGRYPGLVLFSEIFQVTGPIGRTAAMLAGHGFVVAVPEIFHDLEPIGCVIAYDDEGAQRGNAHKVGRPIQAYDDDTRAVIDWLKGSPHCTGRIGSMGICVGGHLNYRACMNDDVLAGVSFYATDIHKGSLGSAGDDSLARTGEIRGELCMFWGRQDPHVPSEGRRMVYNALVDNGVNFTWHEFNGQHAFLRDEGPRYDPELARICMGIAIDLFRRKLNEGDLPIVAAGGPAESRH
jgi:carboxymethylenebutenolidase